MKYVGITLASIHLGEGTDSKEKVSNLYGVMFKKPKDTQIPQVGNPLLWESGSCWIQGIECK